MVAGVMNCGGQGENEEEGWQHGWEEGHLRPGGQGTTIGSDIVLLGTGEKKTRGEKMKHHSKGLCAPFKNKTTPAQQKNGGNNLPAGAKLTLLFWTLATFFMGDL